MQALHSALKSIVGVKLAQVGPINSVFDFSIFLKKHLRRLLFRSKSIVDVGMESHLTFFCLHDHWSCELL